MTSSPKLMAFERLKLRDSLSFEVVRGPRVTALIPYYSVAVTCVEMIESCVSEWCIHRAAEREELINVHVRCGCIPVGCK